MFQFFRRVSGSLLPRPDRPWREDATSHAPTIGRKRRYSLTDQDPSDSPSSVVKRTKNDLVKECDTVSDGESIKVPVEPRDVKEVTKGVEEVDLEDKDKTEDLSSTRPEGIPLPDSPSPSPGPESDSPELVRSDGLEATTGEADGEDSIASSLPPDEVEDGAEDGGRTEAESVMTYADASTQEVAVPTVESGLHDTPEVLEVKE